MEQKIRNGFRQFYTILLTLLSSAFLAYAAFFVEYQDPAHQIRVIDLILGFVLGVGLTPVISFHFGSSQGSKDKMPV